VFTERRVFRPEVAALEGTISSRGLTEPAFAYSSRRILTLAEWRGEVFDGGIPNHRLVMVPFLRTWGHVIQLQRLNDTE